MNEYDSTISMKPSSIHLADENSRKYFDFVYQISLFISLISPIFNNCKTKGLKFQSEWNKRNENIKKSFQYL